MQKQMLINNRHQKESKLKLVANHKNYSLKLKKEMELIKREERLENVQRIAKANQYQKDLIKSKIAEQDQRGASLKKEKEKMLETRFTIRRKADKQKKKLLDKVEQLKSTGKFNKESMVQLGIIDVNENNTKEEPQVMHTVGSASQLNVSVD